MMKDSNIERNIRFVWIGAIWILLIAVLVQTYRPYVSVPPLRGVSVSPSPKIALNWQNWFSGEYQKNYEAWFDTHVGFRTPMVLLANQINFSVFRQTVFRKEGTKLLLGKDNWLYEGEAVRAYQWPSWRTDLEMEQAVEKLARLQQLMEKKRGIPVPLVIAPSKPEIYPEHMDPTHQKRRMNVEESVFSSYQRLVPLLKNKNVLVGDGRGVLMKLKNTKEHPFFAKSGMHWNDYAAFLVLNDLRDRVNPKLHKLLPSPKIMGFEKRPAEREDIDLAILMNIYTTNSVVSDQFYPLVKPPDVPQSQKPRVLIVGDSFSYQLAYVLKHYGMSREVFIYDYFQTLRTHTGKIIESKSKINWNQLLSSYDLIIIEVVENMIPEFGFGFVDEALAYLEPRSD